jgi:hypothetical protein
LRIIIIKFKESRSGLYYYDAKPTNKQSNDYSFLNSVNENKSLYTRRQLKSADLAKWVYELVSRPSHATSLKMIRENQLQNCPITAEEANRALKIYGTDVAALRGKTTRTTPTHVPSDQIRPLPFEILDAHRDVTLCFDIFFVNEHTFVGTVSRNLHFVTAEHFTNCTILTHVLPCLKRVLYNIRPEVSTSP